MTALAEMIAVGGTAAIAGVLLLLSAFWIKERYWPNTVADEHSDGPY